MVLGNCLELLRALPTKSIDHTITDPPYEAECHDLERMWRLTGTGADRLYNKTGKGQERSIERMTLDFDAITEDDRLEAAREIVRVTKGWALVFAQDEGIPLWRAALCAAPYYEDREHAPAKWRRLCIWHKTDAMPKIMGDAPAQGHEPFAAVWCGTGHSVWNGGGRSGVFSHASGANKYHPTEKPLGLMRDLIVNFTMPGDLVLDPFGGSGATPVAAKEAGRDFLVYELNPVHVKTMEERLAKTKERRSFEVLGFSSRKMKPRGAGIVERAVEHLSFDLPVKKKRKPRRMK